MRLTHGAGALVVIAAGVAGRLGGTIAPSCPPGFGPRHPGPGRQHHFRGGPHHGHRPRPPVPLAARRGLRGLRGRRARARGAGQTISADFAFDRVTTPGDTPQPQVRVSASNVSLDLGGVVSLTGGTALLAHPDRPGRTYGGTWPSRCLRSPSPDPDRARQHHRRPVAQTLDDEPARPSRSPWTPTRPSLFNRTGLDLQVLGQTLRGDLDHPQRRRRRRVTVRLEGRTWSSRWAEGAGATVTQVDGTTAVLVPSSPASPPTSASASPSVRRFSPGAPSPGYLALSSTPPAPRDLRVTGPGMVLDVLGQQLRGLFTLKQTAIGTAKSCGLGVANATWSCWGCGDRFRGSGGRC